MNESNGVLPRQTLREMITADVIIGNQNLDAVRPSSLDLTISDEIYRIEGIFLPWPNRTIRDSLKKMGATPHDIGHILERGTSYLARIKESCRLPKSVYGLCNPKSSTGRIDVHVRTVADGVPRFDKLFPAGFEGGIWLIIQPKSFPIKLSPGVSLCQSRFFSADTRLSFVELQLAVINEKIVWNGDGKAFHENDVRLNEDDRTVTLTADLRGHVVGWESIPQATPLDLAKRDYNPNEYFRPVTSNSGLVRLQKGRFYIIRTAERVRVPPTMACELLPIDPDYGDFRTHYAGFVDPGWGFGSDGNGTGRPLVLEVRPYEDVILRPGQPVAKARFEKMARIPDRHYDLDDGSNYQGEPELPKLSKHFNMDKLT